MQCLLSEAGWSSVASIPNHSRISHRSNAHCPPRPAKSHSHCESTRNVVCNSLTNDALTTGPPRPGPPPYTPAPLGEFGERIIIGEFDDEDEDMNIKLECDESGCVLVVGKKLTTLVEDKSEGLLHCSLTGCFYDPEPPLPDFKVIEGQGWRLGFETAPESEDSFSAMVGAGGWSLAMTASEFNDFTKLIQMLRKGIVTMNEDGIIGKDEVVMQVERGSVWMECILPKKRLPSLQRFWKGFKGSSNQTHAFEIRFVLSGENGKRQAEGYWPAEAVMDMLKQVDELTRVVDVPHETTEVEEVAPTPAAA